MKDRYGFTLIELLVTIVIIGILAGIGIFYFRGLFMRSSLEATKNNVSAFYQRTSRYASSEGVNYIIEVNKSNDFMRCMKDATVTSTKDSLSFQSHLDLDFTAGGGTITFTINSDGTVDESDTRYFTIGDSETGKTAEFYISPLGVMEAQIK